MRRAFLFTKAANADVWEDLSHIQPPTYHDNPLNLDRFSEKVDEWGMTVTEDIGPAQAKKYVFQPFCFQLLEVLQVLYFTAAKEGKIKAIKAAKRWLNQQERVDAPQVPAKRWNGIRIQHDGKNIHLQEWRNFWGQCVLHRRKVQDWSKGDTLFRLLGLLPASWIKRATKEEAKRAKSHDTVKMMPSKELHKRVIHWPTRNVSRDFKKQSLRSAFLITLSGDREKAAIWLLDDGELAA